MAEEKKSLASVFGQALTHIGPGLIAAMGSKDPQQIYENYNQGMTALQKDQQDTLNREEKRAKLAENISNSKLAENSYDFGFVHKGTGQTVRIDKRAGTAFDLKGNEIKDIENIVEGETYRKMMGLQAIERRSVKKTAQGKVLQPGLSDADAAQLNILDQTISDAEQLINYIEKDPNGRQLTGLIDGTIRAFFESQSSDIKSAEKANARLKLQSMFLGEILKNTEKTKGAISDYEMKLFMSPVPTLRDGEEKIRLWLMDRANAAKNIRRRIATGQFEPGFRPADPSEFDNFFKGQELDAKQREHKRISNEEDRRATMPLVQSPQGMESYDPSDQLDAEASYYFKKYGLE